MGKTAVKSKNEKQGAKGKFFFLLSEDFVLVNNMFSNTSVLHALFQFLPYSPIVLSSNFMDSLFSPLSPFSALSAQVYGCKAICWSMGSLSGATSLQKISPSSLSSYQLPIAHQLRVGYITLPKSWKVFEMWLSCADSIHAATTTVSSVRWHCGVPKTCSPTTLDSLPSSCAWLWWSLSLGRRGVVMFTFYLRLTTPSVYYPLHFGQMTDIFIMIA